MSDVAAPGPLVLGPMLRFVGEHAATVWVETAGACTVTVRCARRHWSARTFGVRGHHYALVVVDGLERGTSEAYTVEIDGVHVWPEPSSPYPPPRIRTLDRERPTRLAFGSCRTSVSHDAAGNASHGVDALRTLALALAEDRAPWADLVVFIGDQVYADETSDEMRAFIAARRSLDEPPGVEIKDYEEYAHLYWLAWSDPANRWLLANLPTCMIFDDHDIRDDWNTSWTWHEEINRTPWWHERLMGGLASYWVYQHIGNLSPEELAKDEVYAGVLAAEAFDSDDELDLSDALFDLVRRVDRHPEVYRWSYRRDLGDSRLVVVDSRAARVLEPTQRSMLDPEEVSWLDQQLTGDVEHLFIGTSLPFLLPPGLHDLEAIDEAAAEGAYGRFVSRVAEKSRRSIDLEHWAAFNQGFVEVFAMVMDVARGNRGTAPGTIVFLSGDVHNSYVAEVTDAREHGASSRIVQAVCSPIRNPMPRGIRVMMSAFSKGLVRPMNLWRQWSSRVPDPPYAWEVTRGPWFDNCLAELAVDERGLSMTWRGGDVRGGDEEHPALTTIATVRIDVPPHQDGRHP
ncbi:glycoside hydrolase [Intrasporangium oryzae NRRL B-24470]|uniref:Glycoside hydrolase n=1 Tax=Intrasporangium oryzae NRRL B-24470 TaxID=1386089 RepID=W9G8T7_9MICO|nr:alkaline phosphatase D family protein [Intrasporangium oryzae]EWT01238.1 glycoside hydrolase [Intrasporangium oryzae NRRL B-24470]